MDEKTRARRKDDILEYLFDEYPKAIPPSDIARIVTSKTLTTEQIIELCEEIISDDLDVLQMERTEIGLCYKATDKTGEFIFKLNGFKAIKVLEEGLEHQERMREIKRGIQQDKLNEIQGRNLTLNNKTYWIPIVISLAGVAIALASYFKPSGETSQQYDTSRLVEIEKRLEGIEMELKLENDSLRQELQKVKNENQNYKSDSLNIN